MPIILARIDDRLIHGQVTEAWCKKLNPDVIIVVSKEIASSNWQCNICLAALPECIKGSVISVDDAPRVINDFKSSPYAVCVLFESPKDTYMVIKNDAQLTEVNVGGMHSAKGKRQILDYIYVDETDTKYLKSLIDLGITLNFRDIPDHENVDVISLL